MYVDINTAFGCSCALSFTQKGAVEYAEQPLGTVTDFLDNDFAIEFWMYPTRQVNKTFWVWGTKNIASTSPDNTWAVYIVDVSISFFTLHFNVSNDIHISTQFNLEYGNWYHVVINRKTSSAGSCQIWVNGKLRNQNIIIGANNYFSVYASDYNGGQVIRYGNVGIVYTSPFEPYQGLLAQCRAYSRPLKQAEILHNARFGFNQPFNACDIVLWAPLNNNSGNLTTSVHSEMHTSIQLFNFGSRTTATGGAWVKDCPEPELVSGACGEVFGCDTQQAQEDEIYVLPCDFLALPTPFCDSRVTVTDGNSGNCYDCQPVVDNNPVGFFTTNPNYFHNNYEFQYNTFAFRIDDIAENAVFYMRIICGGAVVAETAQVERVDFPDDELFILGILSEINLAFAPQFVFTPYIAEGGVIYVKFISAQTEELKKCLCSAFIFTRNFYNTEDFETEVPTNKRPTTSACIITDSPTNYVLIDSALMCITKVKDLTCLKEERLLQITADCEIGVGVPGEDCIGAIAIKRRLCFGEGGSSGKNFFTNPINFAFHCETLLLRYRNEDEQWKIARIPAVVKSVQYKKNQEVSVSSRGVMRKLLSITHMMYEIETNFMKMRFHTEFLRAIESDYIELEIYGEWVRMVNEGELTIEWEDTGVPYLGKTTANLTSYENKYLNNFC
jgi:hypothetical protein